MYTLQPQRGGSSGAASTPRSSKSGRFKVVKKLTRRYRGRRSLRHPHHRPLVSTDSMILHELIPAQPMPSEQELNAKFTAMVVGINSLNRYLHPFLTLFSVLQDELGLNREIMLKLPLQKKWQLYLSKYKVRNIMIVTVLLQLVQCWEAMYTLPFKGIY